MWLIENKLLVLDINTLNYLVVHKRMGNIELNYKVRFTLACSKCYLQIIVYKSYISNLYVYV